MPIPRRDAKAEKKIQALKEKGLDVDGMVARLLADPSGESGKVYEEIQEFARKEKV
jgi:hypothetical protein